MYQAFYEQYKNIHGSYKGLIQEPEYQQKIEERDKWILEQIYQVIKGKDGVEKQ